MRNNIVVIATIVMLLLSSFTAISAFAEQNGENQPPFAPNSIKPLQIDDKVTYAQGEIIIKINVKEPQRNEAEKVNEILSRLKNEYNLEEEKPVFNSLQEKIKINDGQKEPLTVYKLKTNKDVLSTCTQLSQDPDVVYAEPNYIAYTTFIPNDPRYPEQWSHQNTHAEDGWDIEQGDPNAVIAIIDTGVAYNHEDLASNIWRDGSGNPGRDFVDIDTGAYISDGWVLYPGEDYTQIDDDPSDYYGHGTHCAGIADAVGNNGEGVAGVCHKCLIMPVRAGFSTSHPYYTGGVEVGVLEYDDVANAILYAADNGANIISMSFGGYTGSQLIKDSLDYAYYQKGVTLIAAAGNTDNDLIQYPAAYNNVIAVSATAQDDTKAYYSSYGAWIDIAAPGGDRYKDSMILSTVPYSGGALTDPSGYMFLEGTSMACPYVAGTGALILSKNPQVTNTEICMILQFFSDDIGEPGKDFYFGYGRVNVYRAVEVNFGCAITSPLHKSFIKGDVEISGHAFLDSLYEHFQHYEIYYAPKTNPAEQTLIVSSFEPVENGSLAIWNTTQCVDQEYILTLKITSTQQEYTCSINVIVDNYDQPPGPPPYDGDYWTMFHHNPQHTGYSASNAPNTNNILWTYYGGLPTTFSLSPVVVDGKIYVTGQPNKKIYCLDARNGDEIWTRALPGNHPWDCYYFIAFAYDKIYITTSDRTVYCLNAENGDKIWEYTTVNWIPLSPPTIYEGKVYVVDERGVYCLNATYGNFLWYFPTGGYISLGATPAVADGNVYIGALYDYGRFYCLNALNGEVQWAYEADRNCEAWQHIPTPAAANGKVYVTVFNRIPYTHLYNSFLYCFDAETGDKTSLIITAMCPRPEISLSTPAIAYGYIYISTYYEYSGRSGGIWCVNATNGDSIWVSEPVGSSALWNPTNYMSVADGKIFIGRFSTLYCIDAFSGETIWRKNCGDLGYYHYTYGEPVVANGIVYIACGIDLCAFRAQNPPNEPYNPYPQDGAISVPIDVILNWTGGDPDGDQVTYDVYFGTVTPPPQVELNQIETTYDPGTLDYETTYYWRIVARDYYGVTIPGPIWHFTTGEQNDLPNNPTRPSGPTSGHICISYDYSTSTTDPNEDNLKYGWDWDDGSPIEWSTGWYSSGETCTMSHFWGDPGTYDVRVKVKDVYDAESDWSDPLTVIIENHPPYEPSNLDPEDDATNVSIYANLSWTGGDPDSCDIVTYDVYFGTANPPSKVVSNQTDTSYDPGTLDYETTYHWKIITWDNHGASTEGPIYNFTTVAQSKPNTVYVDDNADPSWYDPAHVKTIQEGIDNVTIGGTVYVYTGLYQENIIVNKTINLTGENKKDTIIDGDGVNPVVKISVDQVKIKDFTVKGGSNGIELYDSSGNTISRNNIIGNSDCGIYVDAQSNDNVIFHNSLFNNNINASDSGQRNIWDDGYPSGGNYWGDYMGEDIDGDGIGDTPYNISKDGSKQDRYPLMLSFGENLPVADFTYNAENLKVTFDASSSYDRDGQIVNYTWDFGDGNISYGQKPEHTYAEEYKTYNVTLKVTDNDGKDDTIYRYIKTNDTTSPAIQIVKPERAIYINNEKKRQRFFGMAFIIGNITIEVNASDSGSGVEKIEFYINGRLKGNDTVAPYNYTWVKDRIRLFHVFVIKVVAYDEVGNTAFKRMVVRKFL